MFHARRYRHLIELQQMTRTTNAFGDVVETWVSVGLFPATVERRNTDNNNERFYSQLQEEVYNQVRVHMRAPRNYIINELNRFVFEGRVYDITKVELIDTIAPFYYILYSTNFQSLEGGAAPIPPPGNIAILINGKSILVNDKSILL